MDTKLDIIHAPVSLTHDLKGHMGLNIALKLASPSIYLPEG